MFYILSFSYFLIGMLALFSVRKSIFAFTLTALLVPSSSAFTTVFYKNGIFSTDFFFVGMLTAYCFHILINVPVKLLKKQLGVCTGLVLIYIMYFLFNKNNALSDMLKDTRPLIFFIEAFILYSAGKGLGLLRRSEVKLLIYAAFSSTLFWFFIVLTGLYTPQDIFYQNNSFRYLSLATYFCAIIFICSDRLLPRSCFNSIERTVLIFCLLFVVIISNARVLLVATVIAYLIPAASDKMRLIKSMGLAGVVILAFYTISNFLQIDRVLSSVSSEGLLRQLTNRFSPAYNSFINMKGLDHVFGLGLGYLFEIPWFEYRDVDNLNISIDSGYFTFYVKFGLIGIVILALYINYFSDIRLRVYKRAVFLFCAILSVVSAFQYQFVTIGLMLGVLVANGSMKNVNIRHYK